MTDTPDFGVPIVVTPVPDFGTPIARNVPWPRYRNKRTGKLCPWVPAVLYPDGKVTRFQALSPKYGMIDSLHFETEAEAKLCALIVIDERRKAWIKHETDPEELRDPFYTLPQGMRPL